MVIKAAAAKAREYSHLNQVLTVLVEEEESIRRSWLDFFAERGMRLLVFGSAEAFLAGFEPSGEPVEFFFDQDFGKKRGVGLILAGVVWKWPGRTGTSLVTSYLPSDFESQLDSGLLDSVLPKFPVQIFGAGFFEKHVHRQIKRRGLSRFMSDSVGAIASAVQDLEAKVRAGCADISAEGRI